MNNHPVQPVQQEVKEKIEPISLLRKTVKVPDPYLLQFFYPDFIIMGDKQSIQNVDKIIFTGDYKKIATFRKNDVDFIATNTPTFEYDLTDKSELINFVYSKYGAKPPKYLTDPAVLDLMTYDECLLYCKQYWVSRVWFGVKEKDSENTFDFISSLVYDSNLIIWKKYFELSTDVMKPLLTFLFNVQTRGDAKSGKYKELLLKFALSFGNKVKPSVRNYLFCNVSNAQLRGFYLLLDLLV